MRNLATGLLFCLCGSWASSQCSVEGIFIDAILVDPNGADNFDTDNNGSVVAEDEFVRLCNSNPTSFSLNGYTIENGAGVSFSFDGYSLPPGECISLVRDYVSLPLPSGFIDWDQTGSWLSDDGDVITLSNISASCSIAYGNNSCGGGATCTDWQEHDGCLTVGGIVNCSLNHFDILPLASLPVNFIEVVARATAVDLVRVSWTTAQEVNNDYFEVQRSSDGRSFETVGRIVGAGTTSTHRSYHLVDRGVPAGMYYYRIAQVDYDGTVTYSSIVDCLVKGDLLVELRPTLVTDQLLYSVGSQTTATLVIMSLDGSVYKTVDIDSQGALDMSAYGAGLYTITVIADNRSTTRRITKI